ncbi:hypothetical protein FBEOM_1741 [Fusarium beomiforme]|uniref:Uncharacterized protein n=1 Tax=Fusarium beomiforme TaxID=44412 RepID=A0A9P5AV35_9HYPO|nr:hypothetical protein FBEOM_1741 [Fusarium beomiforme]
MMILLSTDKEQATTRYSGNQIFANASYEIMKGLRPEEFPRPPQARIPPNSCSSHPQPTGPFETCLSAYYEVGEWAGFRCHPKTNKSEITLLAWYKGEPINHHLCHNFFGTERELAEFINPLYAIEASINVEDVKKYIRGLDDIFEQYISHQSSAGVLHKSP